MSPLTHLLASWLAAAKTTDNLRDRRLVALSGLLPDLDGAGLVIDLARQILGGEAGFHYYQQYHHSLLHGLFGAVIISTALSLCAQRRGRVALLSFAIVHLHFLCDLVGSRGPSPQDIWPIWYLAPFSNRWMLAWQHQWALDAWPNRLISLALFAACLALAVRLGDSVVGVFNRRADRTVVSVLRGWKMRLTLTQRQPRK